MLSVLLEYIDLYSYIMLAIPGGLYTCLIPIMFKIIAYLGGLKEDWFLHIAHCS